MLKELHKSNDVNSDKMLNELKHTAISNNNVFDKIMEVSKYCSIGQITNALFEVGGEYRRNM